MSAFYRFGCPGCDAHSGACASTELAERWFMRHVRARHPERAEDARDVLVARAYAVGPPIGNVNVDEDADRATATCGACDDWTWAPVDCEEDHHSVTDWLRRHWQAAHAS